MILPAQMIRARLGGSGRKHIIEPFEERGVFEGKSYGLSAAGYDVRLDQDIMLECGSFCLASTIEHFDMPNDLLGVVHDKSTWVRQGLMVHNTVIEPGWTGHLTLELQAHADVRLPSRGFHWASVSRARFILLKGTPIAQVVFHTLVEATEQPYRGKYQDQEAGPQPAREESEG